jgi:hypothetical protein
LQPIIDNKKEAEASFLLSMIGNSVPATWPLPAGRIGSAQEAEQSHPLHHERVIF